MPQSFTFYDPRHEDTYVIELDDQGQFLVALRHVVGVGTAPIVYEYLEDVPQPHRDEIERKINSL